MVNCRQAPREPERSPCVHQLLARSGSFHVDVCSCGALHLGIGPCSIRLTEGAFEELVGTVRRALAAHRRRAERLTGWLPQDEPGEPS